MARRRERRMLTGLILVCLLAPLVPPAAAQDSPPIQPRDGSDVISEPAPDPAADNSQSNNAAFGSVDADLSQWPTVTVRVRNAHSYWLKISEGYPAPSVQVQNANIWAQFGYIPGSVLESQRGEAIYVIDFAADVDSNLQFFVNAGTTHDGSPPAALLTIFQIVAEIVVGEAAAEWVGLLSPEEWQLILDVTASIDSCVEAVEAIDPDTFAFNLQACLLSGDHITILTPLFNKVAQKLGREVTVDQVERILTILKIGQIGVIAWDQAISLYQNSWAGSVVFNSIASSPPETTGTSYVQILALACPGSGPDVSFEIGPMPFTIDPVECTAPTVSLTITDAAGNATPIEATGFMNLDLPAGSYTITEQGSGASASFELPVVDTRETQPPECVGRASCVSIVVSIPSTDAPIPSEPGALHEFFIGSWEGVGTQTNPAIDWPIAITFFPGDVGDVIGRVEYPTLGCGGDLVLTYVDPDDSFQTIEVSEDITYGEENCTDNGSFIVSGTEGCCGMTFRWSSPDGGSTAEGRLDPALDDGGGAPGIEPPTLQVELTVMGTPPGGWTYAIELTAPDAGALVCQELTDPDGDGVYLSDNLAGPGFEDPTMMFFYGARLVEGYGYLGGDAPGAGMRTSCLAEEVATVGEYESQAVTIDTIFTPTQVFEDFGGDASDAYGAAIPVTFRNTPRDDCGLAAVYNVRLDPAGQ